MGKTYYKGVFEFGKIAFVPYTKTKKCLVDIEISIRDAEVIRWVNGKKEVTLITCTDASDDHRVIVKARERG